MGFALFERMPNEMEINKFKVKMKRNVKAEIGEM